MATRVLFKGTRRPHFCQTTLICDTLPQRDCVLQTKFAVLNKTWLKNR